MYDKHPIRLSILHMVPAVAERHGVSCGPLVASVGLACDELGGDGRVVRRGQVSALLRHLARRAGEPTIGFDLAHAADPVRLGPAGEAFFAGRTLRECLFAHICHMPWLQGGVTLRLVERNGRAFWHHRFASADPEQARVLNEAVAGFLTSAIRSICGDPDLPLHVLLPHRAHAPARLYDEKLRTAVSFRPGPETVVSFDARHLEAPNVLLAPRDLGRGAVALKGRDAVIDDATLIASLHLMLSTGSASGVPSLLDAARTLGIPGRSLQRRLAALDTSFERLVDEWRRTRALEMLAEGAAVGMIAHRLGYSHAAHFTRAFRRWQGMSPSDHRRRLTY
ncbi:AraC family transcriptional regulator [Rhodobacter sp. CZR27]|uniref:AraC family transcriptional regulator n=1 Tax=Rhodobacter sp. CZR27 TaxID=2033869 RepID=UPI001E58C4FD|nr:AraC family transcriptional regulator [Rhodobacter sp. CZR27]